MPLRRVSLGDRQPAFSRAPRALRSKPALRSRLERQPDGDARTLVEPTSLGTRFAFPRDRQRPCREQPYAA
jgi:hypothetical protein